MSAPGSASGLRVWPVIAVILIIFMFSGGLALLSGVDIPHSPSKPLESQETGPAAGLSDMPTDPPLRPLVPDMTAFKERALFAPLSPPRPVGPPTVAGHELRGTVVNDDQSFALVARPGSDAVTVIRRGETLGEWTLEAITPDRVIFQRNGRRTTLRLSE